jgi:hypothetical protein
MTSSLMIFCQSQKKSAQYRGETASVNIHWKKMFDIAGESVTLLRNETIQKSFRSERATSGAYSSLLPQL